jgi:hypothetical protein
MPPELVCRRALLKNSKWLPCFDAKKRHFEYSLGQLGFVRGCDVQYCTRPNLVLLFFF